MLVLPQSCLNPTQHHTHTIFVLYLPDIYLCTIHYTHHGSAPWTPTPRFASFKDVVTKEEEDTQHALDNNNQLQPAPPAPKRPRILPPATLAAKPEEMERMLADTIKNEDSIPDDIPIKEHIGKLGLMWPRTFSTQHDAAPLLNNYATQGCPVNCGEDWDKDHIIAALQHGAHKSARSKEALAALHDESNQKVKDGYAKIVWFGDIKDNLPKNLKISPVACIPHKSRAFRVILDLSFNLHHNNKTYKSVNDTTTKQAPPEAMAQLGLALRRIISIMAQNRSKNKPFMFTKLDIKDGFWRLSVSPSDAWNFCYVLPPIDGSTPDLDDITLVVPDALQMGWCESPPFFCAASETARDTIQKLLDTNTILPPHEFETRMIHPNAPTSMPTAVPPSNANVTAIEVFVDDFIALTNDLTPSHILHDTGYASRGPFNISTSTNHQP